MTSYTWKLYKTENPRFPYRIAIEEEDRTVIALWTQDKWPGAKGQIFCLREQPQTEPPSLELLETVAVTYLKRLGKKVEIILDRPRQKRCDFLFLKKPGKDGTFREHIYFRTQAGLREHKSKGRPLLYGGKEGSEIIIDSRERYAWKFPKASVRKDELPAGDYALVMENRYAAVVERKSFDNMVRDLYQVQILHRQLQELSIYPHAAVVIEARYSDFSDKARIGDQCTPAYLVRLLSEISALHPSVSIVYAGNRKMANQWAQAFFNAVTKKVETGGKKAPELMEKPVSYADAPVDENLEVRSVILKELIRRDGGFRLKDLEEMFPGMKKSSLQRVIRRLREEKKINIQGKGSGAFYVIGPEAPAEGQG